MREPLPLLPRGDAPAPLVFHRGARPPFAVRWFGITSLFGHARSLVAAAVTGEQIDARDWMRPRSATKTLGDVARALGVDANGAATLVEALGRPLWIDFVADTGDDRDVSTAVARMLFRSYTLDGRELPRGEILLFGGDTAYPVATVDEIFQRLVAPWNEVLAEMGDDQRPRVVLGVPGNHDWYDACDGFARLFRRSAGSPIRDEGLASRVSRASMRPSRARRQRRVGTIARQLHLDEVRGLFHVLKQLGALLRNAWKGAPSKRRKRLSLSGYEAVQECTYWALPIAPSLDVYAVDRQLGRIDYRQRVFFRDRRDRVPDARVLFVAPDPASAFGERWDIGARMLTACGLRLEEDRVLYLTGDMHHYERRAIGPSMHVIAGGGGAFLHGTRIGPSPGGPPAAAYPNASQSRRLVAQVPWKLMLGGSGFLVHIGFAGVASIELAASLRTESTMIGTAVVFAIALVVAFYVNAGHKRAHPRSVLAVAVPFGAGLGLLPMGLKIALPRVIPNLAGDAMVILVYAFLGALGFGLFLASIAIVGLEHQQAFSVLGHPGFKHFVRLCIHPDGKIEGFTIGKDDPVAPGDPKLIDRFEW